ncbi:amino acid/amide ABC transporter ATP-binding protein 1, HAAT family [Rhizobiales bacterium GAS191]|nr:amino acid/amide ABC transporter ATP-binding protein 1, HAAT family [Rhizobiales bacterium GAS191]
MMRIRDLTVRFGGVFPLDELSADLEAPIAGLIGPNGAGKTSLLNVMSGFVRPVGGRIDLNGLDLLALAPAARVRAGLRRTFQTEQVVEDLSAFDNVLALIDHVGTERGERRRAVEEALDFVGLGKVAAMLGQRLNLFERRMLELAKAVVGKPRLILMDEPAAGLNDIESEALRQRILAIPASFKASILLIDHDVELIRATCEEVLVLDFGRRVALGPTAAVLADEAVRKAYLGVA